MTHRNPLQKLALAALVASLGAMPVLALAGHGHGKSHGNSHGNSHGSGPGNSAHSRAQTLITIDNQFDGKGEVYINGRYTGTVAGDTRATFPTHSGWHSVAVKRPGTNFLLSSVNLSLSHGSNTILPVHPPRGTLRVTNAGDVSLKLRTDGASSVWVNPGGTAVLNVETGNVDLKASIRDPRGEWDALQQVTWVEPGRPETVVLRPDPTVLVVTNHERYPVRALIDGVDMGWIDPGASQETWVRPGRADVVLLDRSGRVRTTTSVVLRKGQDTRVVLQAPVPTRPGVVVTAQIPTVVVSANLHVRNGPGHHRPGPHYRWEWDHRRGSWARR